MLNTFFNYIGKHSWRLFPFDQIYLPIVLTVLLWVPSLWSIGVFILTTTLLALLYYHKEPLKNYYKILAGLFLKLGVMWIIFYFHPECLAVPLIPQIVWLLLYLLWHIKRYFRLYWRSYQRANLKRQNCDQMRTTALRREYQRFDKMLLSYSFTTSMLGGILVTSSLPQYYHWIFGLTIVGSIWSIFVLELAYLVWMKRKLRIEYWIPVLNSEGFQIDRVPLTSPTSSFGQMPLVRLIAFAKDMIYLELTDENKYDTPFVTWLYEGESPIATSQRLIDDRFCGIHRAQPRQTLSYRGVFGSQQTLTYLCVVELEDPNLLQIDCRPLIGKWWCVDHLNHKFSQNSLSNALAEEYIYLRQTVLLAQHLCERRNYED